MQINMFRVKSIFSFSIVFFLFFNQIWGQSTVKDELAWLRYYGSYRLKNQWKVKGELEYRFYFNDLQPHQVLTPRLHAERTFENGVAIGVGGVYFLHWMPHPDYNTIKGTKTEIRPHQYVKQDNLFKWGAVKSRVMLEERWRQKVQKGETINTYRFNFRMRFRFTVEAHLDQKKRFSVFVGTEPMMNMGSEINGDFLDQVRTFGGVNTLFSEKMKLQVAYVNWYQPISSKDLIIQNDIVRLTFFHNIK